MMRVWRLITHHTDKDHALFWTKQNSRIAIGWGAIGDIAKKRYKSIDEITSAIRREYSGLNNSHLGGSSLWNFYSNVKVGDLVVLSADKPRVLVVEVEGDYEWTRESPLDGDYQHQRRVIVRRDLSPDDIWHKAGGQALGQNSHGTLLRCERELNDGDI